jgi:4'-phosphopantetheinyl transferase
MIFLFSAKISDIFFESKAQNVLNALPVSKQQTLGKIKLKEIYHASLAGYALLKEALQRFGLEYHTLKDIEFPHLKKPYFPQGPDFNISHTHDRVICAISTDVQVGVDIEKEVSLEKYQLKKYFNEEELLYINEDKGRFYEVWTKKEAILKATGDAGLIQAKNIRFYGPYAVFAQIKWHLYTLAWDDYHIAIASSREQKVKWVEDIVI